MGKHKKGAVRWLIMYGDEVVEAVYTSKEKAVNRAREIESGWEDADWESFYENESVDPPEPRFGTLKVVEDILNEEENIC